MVEANAAITRKAEERALQQSGPFVGTPTRQSLGNIKRGFAGVNAVGLGAMPQRKLAGQHCSQRETARTLDRLILRQFRSLFALCARF